MWTKSGPNAVWPTKTLTTARTLSRNYYLSGFCVIDATGYIKGSFTAP